MAKRHKVDGSKLESVFARLEEIVIAHSGEDPFDEIFKLIVAKLAFESSDRMDDRYVGSDKAETFENIEKLLRAAERRWPQILDGDGGMGIREEQVHACGKILQDISLLGGNLEVLDSLFENLVSSSQKGSKGQYFTPRDVVDALVSVVDPSPEEVVLDPACGSGGFLLHAMTHFRGRSGAVGSGSEKVYGFDVDARALRVAKAMMLIAKGNPQHVVRLNSLSTTEEPSSTKGDLVSPLCIEDFFPGKSAQGVCDVILTNPPFAGDVTGSSLASDYALARKGRRNERDVLFLERCVQLLRPGGRMAIVLPSGRTGAKSSAFVREWLMRYFRIVSVLSLDRNTFRPHTSQKTDVIIGYKRLAPCSSTHLLDEKCLFMMSEASGKDSRGTPLSSQMFAADSPGNLVSHDLHDAVREFKSFVKKESIDWGSD